jgi:hypothetical protein
VNVFRFEIWISVENLSLGLAFGDKSHNRRNWNTQPTQTRHAAHLVRIHRNSRKRHAPLKKTGSQAPLQFRYSRAEFGINECL